MADFNQARNKINSSGGLLKVIRDQLNSMVTAEDINRQPNEPSETNEEDKEGLSESNISDDKAWKDDKYKENEKVNMEEKEADCNRINGENLLKLNFNSENALQGIIYSEILGRPKSRRRRR